MNDESEWMQNDEYEFRPFLKHFDNKLAEDGKCWQIIPWSEIKSSSPEKHKLNTRSARRHLYMTNKPQTMQ